MSEKLPPEQQIDPKTLMAMLGHLSPFEMFTSSVAGRSGIRALTELKKRGITPEHVEQLLTEMTNGLNAINQLAALRRVDLPELVEMPFRAGPAPENMH